MGHVKWFNNTAKRWIVEAPKTGVFNTHVYEFDAAIQLRLLALGYLFDLREHDDNYKVSEGNLNHHNYSWSIGGLSLKASFWTDKHTVRNSPIKFTLTQADGKVLANDNID